MPITILGKEFSLNAQIIISCLAIVIILTLLALVLIEKTVRLFKDIKKDRKKKEMAIKK